MCLPSAVSLSPRHPAPVGPQQCEDQRVAQPAQDPAVGPPKGLCLLYRPLEPLDVSLKLGPLARQLPAERLHPPADRQSPHGHQHELDDDGQHACHQQPDADRTQHGHRHSFVSPSSSAATGEIATTGSSAATRMTVTPWVCRPMREMAPTGVRSTIPLALMISTSSSGSLTTRIAASLPTRSVTLSVNTPWPARWCIGYSATGVRLPYPRSVMTRTSPPGVAVALPTTVSPLPSLMPITPCVSRPMARTSFSLNRIALPRAVAMRMSSEPVVGVTQFSSSPSWRLIAIRPLRRTLAYSASAVFLIYPFLVTINI